MYDNVSNVLAKRIINICPICGKDLIGEEGEWQTKDFDCLLSVLDLKDIIKHDNGRDYTHEMHIICDNCNQYVSVMFDIAENHIVVSTRNSKMTNVLADSTLKSEYLTEVVRYTNNEVNDNFREFLTSMMEKLSIETSNIDIDNLDQYYIIPKDSV